ncbi:MAG TPA: HlyD family efflux transporter periplasmic adaptor subunit [Candidatus Bathyarchaeia archaeon]|nr:HlyD family efflux transporter periplasmic adaptor subunit [Candidatus Bathyarchaeia archaeon]
MNWRRLLLIGTGLIPAVLAFLVCSCGHHSADELAVAGQVEAVTVSAGSRVGGRVSEVLAKEGQHVEKGDVLVKLEMDEAEATRAAARAKLAQAEATLEKLETGARPEEIRQAEAAAEQARQRYKIAQQATRPEDKSAAIAMEDAARAQRDQAKSDFDRIDPLFQAQAVPQQRYDQARHALDAAEAQLQAAAERRKLAQEGARAEEIEAARAAADQAQAALDLLKNGARKEDLDAARALRDSAAADVDRAEVNLRESIITAPRNGVLESLDIHPGDLVKPGPVVTIADVDDLEMFVYVSAAMLGHLRLGQEVALTADAYPGETFKGTISYIAPTGEFTPRNLQTQEERVQQVFGVKIKMDSFGGRIRAGMSMTAHLPRDAGAERNGAA